MIRNKYILPFIITMPKSYIDKIRDYYMLASFKVAEMLTFLAQAKQCDRFALLTTGTIVSQHAYLDILPSVRGNVRDLTVFLDFFFNVMKLLGEDDSIKFLELAKDEIIQALSAVLTLKSISETERLELTTTFCQVLKDHMTPIMQQFIAKGNLLDLVRKSHHNNKEVIELIYDLTKGKQKKTRTPFCFQFFHSDKKPQCEFLTSKVLRNNSISPKERCQKALEGRALLEKLLTKRPDLKLSVYNEEEKNQLFSSKSDVEGYTIRCLSSEIGLYALGSGLLTVEDAQSYAEKETLEYFLAHQDLPFLRLYTPTELKTLEHSQLWDLTGDYAFILLEEKLIPIEQLSKLDVYLCGALSSFCSYYAIIALREKLISFENALKICQDTFLRGTVLDALFTPDGINAMREGLYSTDDFLKAQSEHVHLSELLKPAALEKRRKELTSVKACNS